ncbi:hypothetical protein [Ferrimonas kyonanensis]|nr:hypothetical protein [Ferrimonas kyonanensis]
MNNRTSIRWFWRSVYGSAKGLDTPRMRIKIVVNFILVPRYHHNSALAT